MEKKSTFNKRKEVRYTPYINGVRDEDGNIVIPPLTEEEKEFIEKFNKEFCDARFNNDESDLHYEMITENKEAVKKATDRLRVVSKLIRKADNGYREMNGEERLEYKEFKLSLFKEREALQEELSKINIKGNIEKDNNRRSVDVSNSSRTSKVGDLSSGNFIFDENSGSLSNCSEAELFDRLKYVPLVEE